MLGNICETATIVPGSEKSAVADFNVYRPVALSPILMKCFEKLVVQHVQDNIPASQDPNQHVIDISTVVHSVFTHLESNNCCMFKTFNCTLKMS